MEDGRQGTRHVIGLDAGGTKTVGVLADAEGTVLRDSRAGPANLTMQGELGVEKVIHAVLEALDPPPSVEALCLGIAGAERPSSLALMAAMLGRLGYQRRVRVVSDARIALAAGAPDGVGLVVVAGTGSIAYGRDGRQEARSGGWGYLLGDEASAYWLGLAAVRQGIRGLDGRGPESTLYERIRQRLGVETPLDLADWIYSQETPRTTVAGLAGVVEEAAVEGDSGALTILDLAAEHLRLAATAVARRLALPAEYPLVLAGGTFRACPSLVPRLVAHLDLPGARVELLTVEPALGAVRLALEVPA